MSQVANATRLDIHASGDTLTLVNNATGFAVTYDLAAGTLAQQSGQTIFPPSLGPTDAEVLGGRIVTLGLDDIAAIATSAELDSTTVYASRSGQAEDRIEGLSIDIGGTTYVYLAATDGEAVGTFRLNGDGTLTAQSQVTDTANILAACITSMTQVSVGGATYLVAASATEDGLTSFRVQNDGSLQAVATLGAEDLLPVAAPQAVETVTMAGTQYVIMASSTSSSLTVLEVGADGSLTAVDQVMDTLQTRFAMASVLETFTVDDHVYVLAAGSDDGLSVFQLLPDGRLLHMETLIDSSGASLSNITDMAVEIVNGEVQLFVVSGNEGGMSQFRLVPSTLGVVLESNAATLTGTGTDDILYGGDGANTILGNGGDDILIDGAGSDVMTGGSGRDIFVLTPDGAADTIMDFQLGVDRLDFSAYGLIYSINDLTVTSTGSGVILAVGDETLTIHSANGMPLSAQDFTSWDLVDSSRVQVKATTPPPPPPDPNPDIVEGTSGNDTLTAGTGDQALYGRAGNDTMTGGAGADFMHGGDGVDIASYGSATAAVVASLASPGANTGDAAGDTYKEVEGLTGSAFNDTLTGDGGANQLRGGNGNDTLNGGAGNDALHGDGGNDTLNGEAGNDQLKGGGGDDILRGGAGADQLEGASGIDSADYSTASAGLVVNLGAPSGNTGDAAGDSYSGVENLTGSAFDDTLTGDAQANQIDGGNGADILSGAAGNDTLLGGAGNDTLRGGAGADILNGGAGSDTADYSSATAGLTADLAAPGSNTGDAAGDSYVSIENLTGTDFDDTLNGDNQANTIHGGGGLDRINGQGGDDVIHGGDGVGILFAGEGTNTVFGGSTFDLIIGGNGADTFHGGGFVDYLYSLGGDDTLFGDGGDDVLNAGGGNDRLDGGAGRDAMTGGAGADTFVFNTFTSGEMDTIADFQNGQDQIEMAGVAGGYGSLIHFGFAFGGTDYTMIIHAGHQILMPGLSHSDLDAGDFVFV